MAFFRFVGLLALALWIGGLATLAGLAAPVLFDGLSARDPAAGREVAGAVFGTLLERFQQASWIAGAVLLLSLGGRAALGPRPRRFGVRMWVAVGMLAASVTSVLYVTPRIERLRTGVSGSMASLSEDDPVRVEFGRWHAVSTGLMALTLVAGVGLLWMEATDRH
jgi:hypothetical protein